jgi:uncharacterized lipoprotein YddW (UPF0748 family)
LTVTSVGRSYNRDVLWEASSKCPIGTIMKDKISQFYNNFADNLVKYSQQHGYRSWLVFLFALALILATASSTLSYPVSLSTNSTEIPAAEILTSQAKCATKQELRGVWLTNIDSQVLFSPKTLKKAIARLAELNFNTLYPTVWNWGYTLYPSEVAEKATGYSLDPHEKLQNRDVLQEIIDRGQKQNMAVIPWFEFGFMAPADSELASRHPEWLVKRTDGTTIWWEGDVHQRVWLNPLHPEVQKFITDLVVELVSNYDVDGIQFDDHFGYPSEFGYDEYTVKLYQQEHDGQSPPTDIQDGEWIQWRADKITAYMQQLFAAIKQANPQAIVSLSPNPQEFSLNSFLLDWQKWERLGLIEELIIQVYRDRQSSFDRELLHPSVITAKEHIPVSIGILSGLKGRPVLLKQIDRQIQTTRDRHFAGVSLFFYESLWNLAAESPEKRQNAWKSWFIDKVDRPNLLTSKCLASK